MPGTVRRFEDLVAWQKARQATVFIHRTTGLGEFARDFGLRDQIRRASVSTMANVAEGFERRRPAEFARFLDIAKASSAEVQSHLYLALDLHHLTEVDFTEHTECWREVSRVIARLRGTILVPESGVRNSELGTRNSA